VRGSKEGSADIAVKQVARVELVAEWLTKGETIRAGEAESLAEDSHH